MGRACYQAGLESVCPDGSILFYVSFDSARDFGCRIPVISPILARRHPDAVSASSSPHSAPSEQLLTVCSRNPQCLLLRAGGPPQHPGHRPSGTQSGRSLRPLQPQVLHQDCSHGSEANGTFAGAIGRLVTDPCLALEGANNPREEPDLQGH